MTKLLSFHVSIIIREVYQTNNNFLFPYAQTYIMKININPKYKKIMDFVNSEYYQKYAKKADILLSFKLWITKVSLSFKMK